MDTIQASEFKAKCLALMDAVAASGIPLVITKNGRPIAELRAYRPPRAASPFSLGGKNGKILGDIISPVAIDWDAQQ
jgi:prevent-host-death family protein